MHSSGFDALTRTIASGPATRRAALRLLSGAALGTLAVRPDLSADARSRKTEPQRRRRRAAPTTNGALMTEGQKKGKGKKGRRKPKPKPSSDPCGASQWQCRDGSCVAEGACCPEEKACGGVCVSANQCCPGDDQCCDPLSVPLCGGECEEPVCVNGAWVCRPKSRECRWPQDYWFDPEVCQYVLWCDNGFCPPHYQWCGHLGLCESSDPNLPATCATNHTQCGARICCQYGCCDGGCCPPL